MASVVGKIGTQAAKLFRVGRCLRGSIDGKAVFRFTREVPKQVRTVRRPGSYWIREGWFSANLLDE